MGRLTFSHTIDGSEAAGGLIAFWSVPTWTGQYTVLVALDRASPVIANLYVSLYQSPTVVVCNRRGLSITTGQAGNGMSMEVGNPSFDWACTTWNRFQLSYNSDTQLLPVGTVMTVTIEGAGIAGVNCEYGTRVKAGMPAVQVLDDVVLSAAIALIPGFWWQWAVATFVGTTTNVTVLCSNPPAQLLELRPQMLINPGAAALEVLHATLWPYYCECIPGATTPTAPPLPNPPKPPGWPPDRTYPPNPTNPCLDISEVLRKLDQVLRLAGIDVNLDTIQQRWVLPFATVEGRSISGLSGEGSFAVDRVLGFRVELTTANPSFIADSTPDYLWDVGWMSVSDGGALLQQRRIARTVTDWYPTHAQLATTFGYFLKAGNVVRVTELLPEP